MDRRTKKVMNETVELFFYQKSMACFYEEVAKEFGLTISDDTQYDYRHILISPDIMNKWLKLFEEKYGKGARMEVNKHVCICGPKISTDLKGNEVMIEEEFITNNMWSDEEDA